MTAGSITRGFRSSGNRYHHGTLNTAEPRKAKRFHDLVKKHGGSSAGDRFSVPRHNLGQFNAEAHAGGFGHGHHETGGHFKWTNTHSKQIDQLPPHSQHSEAPEDNPADDTWDPPRDEPTPELPAAISYTEHLKAGGLPHEHNSQHAERVNHREYAQHGLVHHSFSDYQGKTQVHKKGQEIDYYHPETGDKTSGVVQEHIPGKHLIVKQNKDGLLGKGPVHTFKYASSLPSQHSEEQPPEPVESATTYPNTTTINCDYPALGPPIVPLAAKATEQFAESDYHVFMAGGSIGVGGKGGRHPKHGSHISSHASEEEAKAKAKRMTASLSPGERQHYGMKFHVKHSSDLGGWQIPSKS